jgi:hypothetical protein
LLAQPFDSGGGFGCLRGVQIISKEEPSTGDLAMHDNQIVGILFHTSLKRMISSYQISGKANIGSHPFIVFLLGRESFRVHDRSFWDMLLC